MWTVPVIWGTSFWNRLIKYCMIATLCHEWHFTDGVEKSARFSHLFLVRQGFWTSVPSAQSLHTWLSKIHSGLKESMNHWSANETLLSQGERLWCENRSLRSSICIDVFIVMSSERTSVTTWCHFKGIPHTTDGSASVKGAALSNDHKLVLKLQFSLRMSESMTILLKLSCLFCLCNWNYAVVFSISLSFSTLCHLTVMPEEEANHKLPLNQHGTTSVDISCFLSLQNHATTF